MITSSWEESDTFPIPQPITLPFLSSFSLWDTSSLDNITFFELLELPRLRSFQYRCMHHAELRASLTTFLARSPLLECLDFDTTPFPTVTSVVAILRPLLSLKRLLLCDNAFWQLPGPRRESPVKDDELLAQLTPNSNGCVCPALTTITLESCDALSDRGLLKFVEARTASTPAGITHLEHIQVSFNRAADEDIFPRLEPLVSAGLLRVSLRYDQDPETWASPLEGLDAFGQFGY